MRQRIESARTLSRFLPRHKGGITRTFVLGDDECGIVNGCRDEPQSYSIMAKNRNASVVASGNGTTVAPPVLSADQAALVASVTAEATAIVANETAMAVAAKETAAERSARLKAELATAEAEELAERLASIATTNAMKAKEVAAWWVTHLAVLEQGMTPEAWLTEAREYDRLNLTIQGEGGGRSNGHIRNGNGNGTAVVVAGNGNGATTPARTSRRGNKGGLTPTQWDVLTVLADATVPLDYTAMRGECFRRGLADSYSGWTAACREGYPESLCTLGLITEFGRGRSPAFTITPAGRAALAAGVFLAPVTTAVNA